MAVVAMQKVAVLAHKSLKEELLEALHHEGVLEVTEAGAAPKIDHTEVQFREAELQFAIQTLRDVASKDTLSASQKPATEESILHAANHTDVRGIIDALHRLEEDDTVTERELNDCQATIEALQPWVGLPYNLDTPAATATTLRLTGTLPNDNYQQLDETLQRSLQRTSLLRIQKGTNTSTVVAHVWKEDHRRFEEIATTLGWTTVDLPGAAGTADAVVQDMSVRMRTLQQRKQKNHDERVRLSVELPNLLKVATFMRWLDEKQQTREAMAETDGTVTLLGWMPRKNIDLLESRLQKVSPAVAILRVKAEEGEEPPVLLKNTKMVTPFQSVTGLYGLPLYNEWDPTRSLSPFFILYFALCLTDAGYGAILALVFGITLLKMKKTAEEAPLLWLLFMCGIVTFLVSIPFGGWLGLPPEVMPEIFTKTAADGTVLYKGQIWNLNQKEGINFLTWLSLALGLTHLFFGMFLAGWYKWIHERKAAAFWLDFTNHLLLGAIILYVVQPSDATLYVLYGAIALLIWGKGYGSKWFLRPLMGLLGTINFSIGMLSNTLSYLRILALGLVTGALAGAVNQVAAAIGGLLPLVIAIPIIVIIFVVGHTISIALNSLGSFIHSGRLQFIEFFSQFFEGGGRGFAPFRRSNLS